MRDKDEDRRLADRILTRNDQGASARLVNKYRESLLQFVTERIQSELEAEDLLQEVFTRVFNGLHSFDPHYAFSTWLYNIASHCCIDYLRKKGRSAEMTRLDETTVFREEIVENAAISEERADEPARFGTSPEPAEKYLEFLPEKYREVFRYRYIDKLKYRQISENTGLPIGTVKTYLFRAKAILNVKAKGAAEEKP